MNKNSLKKTLNAHIRIRPTAKRYSSGQELEQLDDDWIIRRTTEAGVEIFNVRTHHGITLGYDHIHHFTSDPDSSQYQGAKCGFLTLNVQVHMEGNRTWVEPISPPGKPA